MVLNRWNKIWIVATLFSLLLYALYWVNSVYNNIYRRIQVSGIPPFPSNFWADPVLPAIGDTLRVIGVFLALLSAYLMWGPKQKPISNIKKYIALAILCEGIFYFSGLPWNTITFFPRMAITGFQSFAYLLQSYLVSLLLIVLSIKVWRYTENDGAKLVKWAGLAALGYLVGIWFVNVFKWLGMGYSEGIEFLLSGTTSLGFFNSVITLSLAIIFAVAGFFTYNKQKNKGSNSKLISLALIMLGLHFVFFIIYVAINDAWRFVFLTEFWPITLLGLGLSMFKEKI